MECDNKDCKCTDERGCMSDVCSYTKCECFPKEE